VQVHIDIIVEKENQWVARGLKPAITGGAKSSIGLIPDQPQNRRVRQVVLSVAAGIDELSRFDHRTTGAARFLCLDGLFDESGG